MKHLALVSASASALLIGACGSGTTVTVTTTTSPSGVSLTTLSGTTPVASTPTAATGSVTTQTPTSTTSAPPAPTLHLATFKSPSGNIGCMIIGGTARCDIQHRSWSPPPTPKSCPPVVNYGQGLVVGHGGPGQIVCAGDTTRDPAAQALPYDSDTTVDSFTCASRTTGMTCTATGTGHGFFISFQSYRTF